MRGWLPGRVLSGSLNGSGPAGGLPLWKAGRLTVSRGLVSRGVVGLPGAGIEDTPAVVGCWGCCGRGGLLVVGASACLVRVGVACCRGSGAVRPGCLACASAALCGWWEPGVGGLVVNCIVDASILL